MENCYRKKRYPDESHKQMQTHGNLIYFSDHVYIYSLLIEKGICDRQNISSFCLFVTFIWRSLFSVRVFNLFSYLLIYPSRLVMLHFLQNHPVSLIFFHFKHTWHLIVCVILLYMAGNFYNTPSCVLPVDIFHKLQFFIGTIPLPVRY